MKVVLFAGGKGTRISEESHLRPKPMIEIGGMPIIWHIMKNYAAHGHNEFVICLGYKGYMIKEYFLNYFVHHSDVTVNLGTNEVEVHRPQEENIKVSLVDTGLETMTAGRLKKVQSYIGNEDFMLTYGDGLSNIDVDKLVAFHQEKGKICTMSIIQPGSRFGVIESDENDIVKKFVEKPKEDGAWINGGFFVLSPKVFDYLHDDADDIMWERQPLQDLAKDGELATYKHHGFWKCMDTMRDKTELEQMWASQPEWKNW